MDLCRGILAAGLTIGAKEQSVGFFTSFEQSSVCRHFSIHRARCAGANPRALLPWSCAPRKCKYRDSLELLGRLWDRGSGSTGRMALWEP